MTSHPCGATTPTCRTTARRRSAHSPHGRDRRVGHPAALGRRRRRAAARRSTRRWRAAARADRHAAGRPRASGRRSSRGRGRATSACAGTVECEDGVTRHVDGALPDDFPLGYHRLHDRRRHRPPADRVAGPLLAPRAAARWGWAVQLYAARSPRSWGIGDLADLRALRGVDRSSQGAGFLLVNPLHAVAPDAAAGAEPLPAGHPPVPQPALPARRDVPGAERRRPRGATPAGAHRRPLIDRDASGRSSARRSTRIFDAARRRRGFAAWRAEQRARRCEDFALLVRARRRARRRLARLARRSSATRAARRRSRLATQHGDDVAFHAWLQWRARRCSCATATGDLTVLQDLPDRRRTAAAPTRGSGRTCWPAASTVGAPPDVLNTVGQDWGSPPLVPWRLRDAGLRAVRRSPSAPPSPAPAGSGSTT